MLYLLMTKGTIHAIALSLSSVPLPHPDPAYTGTCTVYLVVCGEISAQPETSATRAMIG